MSQKDLVLRNRWTSKYHLSAHEGKTPEQFVNNYILRPGATEQLILAPSELKLERDSEHLAKIADVRYEHPSRLRQRYRKYLRYNWRGFGKDSLSYNGKQELKRSRIIQSAWNSGHSVYKLVMSMTSRYMRSRKLVDPQFRMNHPRDAFGQVDELKARYAFQKGMDSLLREGRFVHPVWVAAMQLDTRHVHFHAVVVDICDLDRSKRLVPSYRQKSDVHIPHLEDRGTLYGDEKRAFKNTYDYELRSYRPLPIYHLQPDIEKQNIISKVGSIAHDETQVNSNLQQLMISLPKDRSMWFYQNRSPIMRRPNQIMNNYLYSLIERHGTIIGYDNSLAQITKWAHHLSRKKHQRFKKYRQNGLKRLKQQMANSIYHQLRLVSRRKLKIWTPYLSKQSYDLTGLRRLISQAYKGHSFANQRLTMFLYRIHSCPERYRESAGKRQAFSQAIDSFDKYNRSGQIQDPLAMPLRDHYLQEELYNAQVMDKYRYLLNYQQVDPVTEYKLEKSQKNLVDQYHSVRYFGRRYGAYIRGHQNKMPITYRLLHTNNNHLKVLLNAHISGSSLTLGESLVRLENDYHFPINKLTQHATKTIENNFSGYQGLTREINNRKFSKPIMNPQYQAKRQDYIDNLYSYTERAYSARLLNSQELIDCRLPDESLPEPPRLHKPAVNRDDFERVKGVDMQNCFYDFNPGQSRKLSKNTINEFHYSSMKRLSAIDKTMPYINELNQADVVNHTNQYQSTIKQFSSYDHNLINQFQLSQDIDNSHQMPVTTPAKELHDQQESRNQVTFDLSTAHDYTRRHLDELNNDNEEFDKDINNHPQEVLEDNEFGGDGYNQPE